ncbi:MAG: 16S rRNA (cytidine(1402)-2'-O)-methyltransferase [Anaerolineales bacterium]|nr:16S rRNA (cytidine(1402)-2'-O)-methyltransferase [Anaerolineales bacterium]
MSILYLIATPIGNLEDISARALKTLREVTLILAEDTRHTGKLLAHYGIKTPLSSYYEHNKIIKLPEILARLQEGDLALVSDAGTPLLNDPGYELVRSVLTAGHDVSPIPGPSAPLSALIVSGLPADAFLYLGYLPRKDSDRRQKIKEITELPYTIIFLEAPHRLLTTLSALSTELGDRQIAVARELTKLYEEVQRGTIREMVEHFTEHKPRGEFTLVIDGFHPDIETWSIDELKREIEARMMINQPATTAAKEISIKSGWPRRKVYNLIIEYQQKDKE